LRRICVPHVVVVNWATATDCKERRKDVKKDRELIKELLKTSEEYVPVADAVKVLGLSRQRVVMLCQRGGLPGATKVLGRWWIPQSVIEHRKNFSSQKPENRRKSRQGKDLRT
jgi:hypothetical protein